MDRVQAAELRPAGQEPHWTKWKASLFEQIRIRHKGNLTARAAAADRSTNNTKPLLEKGFPVTQRALRLPASDPGHRKDLAHLMRREPLAQQGWGAWRDGADPDLLGGQGEHRKGSTRALGFPTSSQEDGASFACLKCT